MTSTTIKALIVGGSSGIGFETAKLLRQQGIGVQLLGRDATKLANTKQKLDGETGGMVETTQIDLYDAAQLAHLIEAITADRQHIQYLVNEKVGGVDCYTYVCMEFLCFNICCFILCPRGKLMEHIISALKTRRKVCGMKTIYLKLIKT